MMRLKHAPVVVKEATPSMQYEVDLLNQVRVDGYVPGVPRVITTKPTGTMAWGDAETPFREPVKEETRTERRIALGDFSMYLGCATTVNDLLKAVYDVLEVHRTVALRHQHLHRNISITVYLQRSLPAQGAKSARSMSPLIDEVLTGSLSVDIPLIPHGLMIDFDHPVL
ncbi:hypothetical protein GY45DRAFT_1364556, partial [Cubamyces sp. BRFM 1775]